MDIAQIRRDIAALINNVADPLTVYPFMQDQVTVPAAIITPEPHELVDTYATGRTINFRLTLLVSPNNMESGQEKLDAWISTGGPSSMVDAINEESVSSASSLMAKTLESYGMISLQDGGTRYLAADILIEVICD